MEADRAERQRIAKRDHMRRRRADPEWREATNARRRALRDAEQLDKERAYYKELQRDRFVWAARQHRTKYKVPVTADDLRALWDMQGGHCVLSGRPLDQATAHLDHIQPVARGGASTLDNLRWLDPEVNLAKRALTDEEFLTLCRQVAHVGG